MRWRARCRYGAPRLGFFFFFNDPPTPEIYTLSLPDPLPILRSAATLLNLLQQATVVADRTELLAPIGDDAPPPSPPRPGRARTPDVDEAHARLRRRRAITIDRKSTRLNSSHSQISYAVFCLK